MATTDGPSPAQPPQTVRVEDEKNSMIESQQEPHAERKLQGLSWVIVIMAVFSPTFLYALDNTIMANVRPSVVETFGKLETLTWLSVSYPMGEVGSNPLWGKLNQQFDNKIIFLAAVTIFEAGSAVIGSAQNVHAVIIGRAVAGFGGSGIYVSTINIISAMTVPAERNQYLTYVGMAWSLGTVLGPVIGGAFADSSATWRWAFYINICIAALSMPACIWLVPPVPQSTLYKRIQRIKRLDYLGTVLFLGGVVATVMVLGFGGAEYDWKSGQMIGLYVAVVAIWAAFSIQQGFNLFTVDRIFPAQFVTSWEMITLFSWNAIAISNIVVTIYSLPLFFQFAYGDSSLKSALYTLPFVFSAVASAGAGGAGFSKYPVYMHWFAGASALMLISNGLLSTIKYTTSRGAICGYTVLQGIGVGPVIQLAYTVGQTKFRQGVVQRELVPQVTAFLTCAQMAGLTLSLGIATSVFLNRSTEDISAILPGTTRDLILASINGARTGLLESIGPQERFRILQAIARNVGKVFYMNIAGAGLGFALSLFMKRESLNLEP
ncbi:putative efflux pump antibiotic resistance protein [Periconia macrospinosa]|uniref:Putative efflux pump antibiotic resistance protein n=1 Tax=Periconia macrospinosa TaxID=97972 RepID=A0A2V1DW30_9PLEO|nr:putative efflux pump antibiotic resistance protein [Periconia macrospinosa]